MPSRPPALAISLALVVSACGGGAAGPRPAPRLPVEAGAPDPLAAPWVVRRTGEPISQTIHVAAVLESTADSSRPPMADTLQSQLSATWTVPSSGFPRRYLGTVTDYRLSAAVGDSLVTPADLPLPFSFTAEQPSRIAQPSFVTPDASVCDMPQASIVHGVRDLWLSLPDTLRADLRWSDSVTYVVCRDSIPLTMDVRRDFRVTGAMWRDSTVVVTVERRTETHLNGTGRQFGDSVTLSGEGTGAAMFEVSLRTGAATFASGESELRVTLRGSRRIQQLTQRSRISILDR
jgi:hypothetical protein